MCTGRSVQALLISVAGVFRPGSALQSWRPTSLMRCASCEPLESLKARLGGFLSPSRGETHGARSLWWLAANIAALTVHAQAVEWKQVFRLVLYVSGFQGACFACFEKSLRSLRYFSFSSAFHLPYIIFHDFHGSSMRSEVRLPKVI